MILRTPRVSTRQFERVDQGRTDHIMRRFESSFELSNRTPYVCAITSLQAAILTERCTTASEIPK